MLTASRPVIAGAPRTTCGAGAPGSNQSAYEQRVSTAAWASIVRTLANSRSFDLRSAYVRRSTGGAESDRKGAPRQPSAPSSSSTATSRRASRRRRRRARPRVRLARPASSAPTSTTPPGASHPGLIPIGLPVLGAEGGPSPGCATPRSTAAWSSWTCPPPGQQTTDYDEFRAAVAEAEAAEPRYLAVLVSGPPKAVRKLTGSLGLLR